MATVQLTGLWVTSLADWTDAQFFELALIELDPIVGVTVRQYAAFDADGNPSASYRATTTPGRQQTAKVTLGIITDDQQKWLSGRMGQTMCFREGKGTKIWGVYTDAAFTPYHAPIGWQGPSFTVQEVTVDESV